MVIRLAKSNSQRGVLELDMLAALALLFVAAIPLMCSFASDARALRINYERAVAMECVDGEMELLAAGAWHNQRMGTNEITLSGAAAKNLHPATALLVRKPGSIQIVWRPTGRIASGIIRELKLP